MNTGTPAPWFVSEGVSTEAIGIGEPRLRRYRGDDRSWCSRSVGVLRRLPLATPRVPALGR